MDKKNQQPQKPQMVKEGIELNSGNQFLKKIPPPPPTDPLKSPPKQ